MQSVTGILLFFAFICLLIAAVLSALFLRVCQYLFLLADVNLGVTKEVAGRIIDKRHYGRRMPRGTGYVAVNQSHDLGIKSFEPVDSSKEFLLIIDAGKIYNVEVGYGAFYKFKTGDTINLSITTGRFSKDDIYVEFPD